MQMNSKDDDLIIEKAVNLSLIEIAIGSVLHSLKVPFTGHFLSLNQGMFLSRAINQLENRFRAARLTVEVSMIVAIMKSLSPAGKKLGPMISISMQGFLFSLGIFFGGTRVFGQAIGLALLSLWSFVQPLITYFLIYGLDALKAVEFFVNKLNKHIMISPENLVNFIWFIIILKLALAAAIPFLIKYLPAHFVYKYDALIARVGGQKVQREKSTNPFVGAFKDMTNPFFIFSMFLMFAFFIFTGDEVALVIWKVLRAFAIAFIIFFLSRSKRFYALLVKLSGHNRYLKRLFELAQKSYLKIVDRR